MRRRRLAAELRRLRLESDKTAEAVGEVLGGSKAKVSTWNESTARPFGPSSGRTRKATFSNSEASATD